ncbi:unnamed protein product [Arabidopsis thaliana]|uniref:Uncharacterized protein n=1 Tax=Arabidopsis thaliana TaxID=3702 RepID=A0A654G5J0_ARATH|nr:unnamed protein product [Arabidopsis thaliana]
MRQDRLTTVSKFTISVIWFQPLYSTAATPSSSPSSNFCLTLSASLFITSKPTKPQEISTID